MLRSTIRFLYLVVALLAPVSTLAANGVFTTGDDGTRAERKARETAQKMVVYASQNDLKGLFGMLPYFWRGNINNVLEMLERRITPATGERLRQSLTTFLATVHAQNANAVMMLHNELPHSYVPGEAKWMPSIDAFTSGLERSVLNAQRKNFHRGDLGVILAPAKLPKGTGPATVPALRACENADGTVEIGLASKPNAPTMTFKYLENEFVWVPKDMDDWMNKEFVRIYNIVANMKAEQPENTARLNMLLTIVDAQMQKTASSASPEELKANLQAVLPVLLLCVTLMQ